MENTYTPPPTRTVYPDKDHLRTEPNYTNINDLEREKFFTTWNKELVEKTRQLNFNKLTQ